MTARIRDESSVTRIVGTVSIGGTAGQVATVGADGYLTPTTVASEPDIPIAQPTGTVVDTTTYDDPFGGPGKITVLVSDEGEQIGLAWAVDGDDFPRACLLFDVTDGWYFGDGTFNPYTHGPAIRQHAAGLELLSNGDSFATVRSRISAGSNRGDTVAGIGPLLSFTNSGSPCLSGGGGAPGGGGEVGDLYFRTDPGGANQTIYRCTTAGAAGDAVWTGIL